MKFDQLTYFVETAKLEHIGKAAKKLAISPSAISHSIATLEKELGVQLFLKDGKRIRLSAQGKKLATESLQILQSLKELPNKLNKNNEPSGHYRLAATHGLIQEYLAPVWMQLCQKFSKLTGELSSLRSSELINLVAKGDLDIGLCYSPHSHPRLNQQALYSGNLCVVIKSTHPLLRKDKRFIVSELKRFPYLAPRALPGIVNCEAHAALSELGIQASVHTYYDSYDVALTMLIHSDSWALVPDWLLGRGGGNLTKLLALKNATYELALVWPKNESECVDLLMAPMKEYLQKRFAPSLLS